MKTMKRVMRLLIGIWSLSFFNHEILRAQVNDDVAIILKSKGKVKVKKEETKNWRDGDRGVHLDSGDIVRTHENSLAAILFTDDKSLLKVRDNSTVAIQGKRANNSISKRVVCSLGDFWLKVSQQKSKLVVETPSGIAAVKGTEFYGIVDSEGNTIIIVIEGMVELMNKLGEALVRAGQTGKLIKGKIPQVFQTDPGQKLNWANDDKNSQELKFEFQDSEGNKKNLKVTYH